MDIYFLLKFVSIGIAVPCTLVVLISLITKASTGDTYQVDMLTLFKIYIVALLGWATFFSIVLY